jgi:hypothetical protein
MFASFRERGLSSGCKPHLRPAAAASAAVGLVDLFKYFLRANVFAETYKQPGCNNLRTHHTYDARRVEVELHELYATF